MVQNNLSFNVVQGHKNEVVAQMNDLLDESWKQQYGIEVQDSEKQNHSSTILQTHAFLCQNRYRS